jgi:hypothetical protein
MRPETATLTLPLPIIAKLVAESKNVAPGIVVSVALPALIQVGIHVVLVGVGADPENPALGVDDHLNTFLKLL